MAAAAGTTNLAEEPRWGSGACSTPYSKSCASRIRYIQNWGWVRPVPSPLPGFGARMACCHVQVSTDPLPARMPLQLLLSLGLLVSHAHHFLLGCCWPDSCALGPELWLLASWFRPVPITACWAAAGLDPVHLALSSDCWLPGSDLCSSLLAGRPLDPILCTWP